MTIYFAFSDENGGYKMCPGNRFLKSTPYYSRSTFIILAEEWKKLSEGFKNIKAEKYNLPNDREIKWSYAWSLYKHMENDKPISKSKSYSFLNGTNYQTLIKFFSDVINLLSDLSYAKVVLTYSDNQRCSNLKEHNFYKWHLQEIMQRLEMELQDNDANLCVLFIDPISEEKNRLLREAYSEIFCSGDFIKRYGHIKDSLNLEFSHHSIGIQIADYIAGCFNGFLRGYEDSMNIFIERVYPIIRKNSRGNPVGYGVREVPKNKKLRDEIIQRLSDI